MKNYIYKLDLPYFFLFVSIIFLIACQNPTTTNSTKKEAISVVRQPAEYDPQAAVWLMWSPIDHKEGYSNEQVTLEIIDALIPHTKVVVTAANQALYQKAKSSIPASALEGGQVELIQIPSEELWTRDMGPNYVELSNGQKAIVDFNFNAWGYTPTNAMDEYTIRMENFDSLIAEKQNLPIIKTELISEGGDREVNGEGVLMVVKTLEKGRNPNWSLAEMEAEFKRVLGVKKVIWLKEGLYEDDHTFRGPIELDNGEKAYTVVTTNGHIDEFARFVNDSTILLAEVPQADMEDPIAQENHRRMEENYKILRQAKDQDGKPFRIIRIPLPKTILTTMKPGDSVYDFISTLEYEDGSQFPEGKPVTVVAAASYLNFLITDKVILGQKYWKAGLDDAIKERDHKAASILEKIFPNRKVIMIDALAINLGGGGIHCITMQEPKI